MTTYAEDRLIIELPTPEPAEERELLIRDIAAIMRWYASSTHAHYKQDADSLYRIGVLLEQLQATA